ncbi:MAG TPA: discoidin domain-containing protein [Thermoguttaceae bacterium]|nr:discoidin domain-containing protein [Thermoguttaceae bacterium]
MPGAFDPYHRWLGIPPEKQPANLYGLLGIEPFEDNPDVIESAADQRMAHLRTFQAGEHGDLSQKLLNEVAAAKVRLLRPQKKAAYDTGLRKEFEARKASLPRAIPVASAAPEEPVPAEAGSKRPKNLPVILGAAAAGVVVLLILISWLASLPGGQTADSGDGNQQQEKSAQPSTPSESKSPAPIEVKTAAPPEDGSPGKTELSPLEEKTPDQPDVPAKTPTDDPPSVIPPEVDPPGTVENPPVTPPVVVPQKQRLAVPSSEAQAAVLEQLKEVYELDKQRTTAEKLELAGEMLALAEKSRGNPTERFVVLRQVMDLACEGGDAVSTFEAIDRIAADFEIDGLSVKAKVLPNVIPAAGDAEKLGLLTEAGLALVDEAAERSQYDVANEIIEMVHRACLGPSGRDYRKRVYDRRVEIERLYRSWQEFDEALAKLKLTPDDPEANLAAGRWYCLRQGDWSQGLPHLAKGSDMALRAAAEDEVTLTPTDPSGQIRLADKWWDLAEAAEDDAKTALMHHAGTWYRKAKPGVQTSLEKIKLDRRLAEIAELARPPETLPEATPPEATPPEPSIVLDSSGLAYSASSTWDEHKHSVAKAFDKDWETRWSSGPGDGNGAWIEARWEHPATITRVVIREAFDRITGFQIHCLLAGTDQWSNAITLEGERLGAVRSGKIGRNALDASANPVFVVDLPRPTRVTGIRVVVTSVVKHDKPSVSIRELEFVGKPYDQPPSTPTPGTMVNASTGAGAPLLPPATGVLRRPTVKRFDPATAMLLRVLQGQKGTVLDIAFSRDGSTLVSAGSEKSVAFWDVASGQPRGMFPASSEGLWSVALSPNGALVAAAGVESTIRLWDTAKGQLGREFTGHTGNVRSLDFSPDGATLASASDDQTVKTWDVATGKLRRTLEGRGHDVYCVRFSPDGSMLASACPDGSFGLWDPATGELRREQKVGSEVRWVTFSPDGKTLASAYRSGTITLWDVATGELQQTLKGHTKELMRVAFHPDGSLLASGGGDHLVRIWNPTTGEILRTISGPEVGMVSALAFSPDGSILAFCAGSDKIQLWWSPPARGQP